MKCKPSVDFCGYWQRRAEEGLIRKVFFHVLHNHVAIIVYVECNQEGGNIAKRLCYSVTTANPLILNKFEREGIAL